MLERLRLGVNIDHVATIRNARGGLHPDPLRAAIMAAEAGADGLTIHLREDRRHITDDDLARLKASVQLPINLEMAATDEMLRIALAAKPNACCIVPERRQERTTEGGLDARGGHNHLQPMIRQLRDQSIRVSLFIEADRAQIETAAHLGADIVELHTGRYCHVEGTARDAELRRLIEGAQLANKLGLEVHAGHGLTFETVGAIAAIPQVRELNIGHFIIGEAVFIGLVPAIKAMRHAMDEARTA
jgi:pyridoxine 5-phosphate synthase